MLPQTALSGKAWVWQEFSAADGFTEKGICPNIILHLRDRSVKYKTYASETPTPISTRLFLFPFFFKGGSYEEEKGKRDFLLEITEASRILLSQGLPDKTSTCLEYFPQRGYRQGATRTTLGTKRQGFCSYLIWPLHCCTWEETCHSSDLPKKASVQEHGTAAGETQPRVGTKRLIWRFAYEYGWSLSAGWKPKGTSQSCCTVHVK